MITTLVDFELYYICAASSSNKDWQRRLLVNRNTN